MENERKRKETSGNMEKKFLGKSYEERKGSWRRTNKKLKKKYI